MKPPIWQVYDWLQTESAYPHGPMPAATCHVDRAVQLGLPTKPGTVLMIGPGSYHEMERIDRLLDPDYLRATSANMLECMEIAEHKFDCRFGDVHDLDWTTGLFNLVFSSNVLEHAFSPYGALLEIRRVLRPGGTIYSVIPTWDTDGGGNAPWHVHCLDLKQWRQLHHWTGFATDMVQEVHEPSVPGDYFHIRAKAVEPPTPHDEVLKRLIALKAATL